MKKFYRVVSDDGIETQRTDASVAHSDVSIFRWLGKKAWIEEIER